jgi:hypothetical protein
MHMKIRKDTIVLTVLRPDSVPLPDTLEGIGEFIDSGDGIGSFTVTHSTNVRENAVREELLAVGNDGSFFEDM